MPSSGLLPLQCHWCVQVAVFCQSQYSAEPPAVEPAHIHPNHRALKRLQFVFPSVLMTSCSMSSSVCLQASFREEASSRNVAPTRAARIKPLESARLRPIQQSPTFNF